MKTKRLMKKYYNYKISDQKEISFLEKIESNPVEKFSNRFKISLTFYSIFILVISALLISFIQTPESRLSKHIYQINNKLKVSQIVLKQIKKLNNNITPYNNKIKGDNL